MPGLGSHHRQADKRERGVVRPAQQAAARRSPLPQLQHAGRPQRRRGCGHAPSRLATVVLHNGCCPTQMFGFPEHICRSRTASAKITISSDLGRVVRGLVGRGMGIASAVVSRPCYHLRFMRCICASKSAVGKGSALRALSKHALPQRAQPRILLTGGSSPVRAGGMQLTQGQLQLLALAEELERVNAQLTAERRAREELRRRALRALAVGDRPAAAARHLADEALLAPPRLPGPTAETTPAAMLRTASGTVPLAPGMASLASGPDVAAPRPEQPSLSSAAPRADRQSGTGGDAAGARDGELQRQVSGSPQHLAGTAAAVPAATTPASPQSVLPPPPVLAQPYKQPPPKLRGFWAYITGADRIA